jgi:thiamine pyridinylase
VTLEWVPASAWDGGYSSDPDPSYDVFIFDAINLGYFQSKNLLLSLAKTQVANYSDLVPFAQTGVTVGDSVLGIPQLGCGDFLFYDASDSQLASTTNINQLTAAMGTCSYYPETPPGKAGLMVDLSGGTTVSSTYVEGVYESSGTFPSPLPTKVDPAIAATLQDVVALSSFGNVLYRNDSAPYQRAAWYSSGSGRAYVGFTESMSQIAPQKLASIRFKPMPWSTNSSTASPLFYSDVVGIGPATAARGTTSLAIQLANLMTSPSVIVASFGPWQSAGPQYLMPVSKTALSQLAAQFPVYAQMANVISPLSPTLFNLGPTSKVWLAEVKPMMKSTVLANPQCYCDSPSPPILCAMRMRI